MWPFRKNIARRSLAPKSIIKDLAKETKQKRQAIVNSLLLGMLFIVMCTAILSYEPLQQRRYPEVIPIAIMVVLISCAAGFYIYRYQPSLIENHIRALELIVVFILLLATAKAGILWAGHNCWATGTAVAAAIILVIVYDQRFAAGMSIFYCLFACFVTGPILDIKLCLTMVAGSIACCFSLGEIRTRPKLLEVGAISGAIVFITTSALSLWEPVLKPADILRNSFLHFAAAFVAAVLIQGFLPVIEKAFRIATSLTLVDYSRMDKELLKKLAMEAPGTYTHSLQVGSIAEAAAEAIGCNGLLCRVGAYYHDIGKINKAGYFTENELGSASRHKELSPAMSQLVIVGHVKDGVEMAVEYKLPAVLRQFIETHHGTTLIEFFYNQARKKHDLKRSAATPAPSESEFRYPGPKPETKEAAIVMLADAVESAVRSLTDLTPAKIEAVVHNMAMRRLQDGQFDECDLSLKELSQIETSMSKTLAAHYHGRISYPNPPDQPEEQPQNNH
jgi:hypothetical protein